MNFQEKLSLIINVDGAEAAKKKLDRIFAYNNKKDAITKAAKAFNVTQKQVKTLQEELDVKAKLNKQAKLIEKSDILTSKRLDYQQKQKERLSQFDYKGIKQRLQEKSKEQAQDIQRLNKIAKAAKKERDTRRKEETRLRKELELKGVDKGKIAGLDTKGMTELNDKMNALTKITKTFKMHWLGIMFAGMALDKAMSGLIKGMIKDYQELTKEAVTPLSESLNGLTANWKFLKFTILSVSSSWVIKLTDFFANMTGWISRQDPKLLSAIGMGILALAAAGKTFMIGGQFALAASSITNFLADYKLNKAKTVGKSIESLGTSLGNMSGFTKGAITAGLALTATISTIQLLTDEKSSPLQRGLNVASMTVLGAWLGSLIAPGIGTAIGAVIGASVGVVINVIDIKLEGKTNAEFTKARAKLQKVINDSVAEGMTLDAEAFYANFQNNIVNSIDSKKLKDQVQSGISNLVFKWEEGGMDDESFKQGLTDLLGGVYKTPEVEQAGEDLKDSLLTPSIDAAEDLVNIIADKGGEAFTVELKESVKTFLEDEESGMAALQTSAKTLNETLSQDINKTVNVTYVYNNRSINPEVLE